MADNAKTFPHPLYEQYVLQPFYVDAKKYYYEPMMAANRAHVVMLYDCGIITHDNATALLSALNHVEAIGLDGLDYRSGVEDLFFVIENALIEHAGVADGGFVSWPGAGEFGGRGWGSRLIAGGYVSPGTAFWVGFCLL